MGDECEIGKLSQREWALAKAMVPYDMFEGRVSIGSFR
jgi:hypothetical protein